MNVRHERISGPTTQLFDGQYVDTVEMHGHCAAATETMAAYSGDVIATIVQVDGNHRVLDGGIYVDRSDLGDGARGISVRTQGCDRDDGYVQHLLHYPRCYVDRVDQV